jgi:hypothetical protein
MLMSTCLSRKVDDVRLSTTIRHSALCLRVKHRKRAYTHYLRFIPIIHVKHLGPAADRHTGTRSDHDSGSYQYDVYTFKWLPG